MKMLNIKNWFKPNDWITVWSKRDSLTFTFKRRQVSSGNILKEWESTTDVVIEIQHSESRQLFRLELSSEDAKHSKYYQEALTKLNELRGKTID